MVGRESFYSPMIRSQSFSESVPLNFISGPQFFSPHLGGTEWLEGAGAGWFPGLVRL